MKNWRDATQYLTELPLHRWRWEFLRRNPEYRGAWEKERINLGSEAPGEFIFAETEDPTRFGLFVFIDPNEDHPDDLFLLPKADPPMGKWVVEVPRRFDLAQPLKPQLDALGELLEVLQTKAQRSGAPPTVQRRKRGLKQQQSLLWQRFLRVLDASDAGATYNEIGQELFGKGYVENGAATAKNAHDRALEFTRNFPF